MLLKNGVIVSITWAADLADAPAAAFPSSFGTRAVDVAAAARAPAARPRMDWVNIVFQVLTVLAIPNNFSRNRSNLCKRK